MVNVAVVMEHAAENYMFFGQFGQYLGNRRPRIFFSSEYFLKYIFYDIHYAYYKNICRAGTRQLIDAPQTFSDMADFKVKSRVYLNEAEVGAEASQLNQCKTTVIFMKNCTG